MSHTHTTTKVIALFFICTGIFHLIVPIINLMGHNEIAAANTLRSSINTLIQGIIFVSGIIDLVVAYYLLHAKKWAYILAILITVVSLFLNILVLLNVSIVKVVGFLTQIIILLLLWMSRKDFEQDYS